MPTPPRAASRTRAPRTLLDGEAPSPAESAARRAFREDLERIRFSPYYSRLAAVTQVISQNGAGQGVHNRLTHTIKVTSVARAIAVSITDPEDPRSAMVAKLGGCDRTVVQAAASAHDLGHPPFGHLGEAVLDRIARNTYGLRDGFDGNAQTFRIITALDALHPSGGMNLTAATRAAVLKYPWCSTDLPAPHPSSAPEPPRGARTDPDRGGSGKFSAYLPDAAEMMAVRAAFPEVHPLHQTPECAVMDIADDIAYSLHDLDDFHRAGVLQHATVSAEFRTWRRERAQLALMSDQQIQAGLHQPGRSLEELRRSLHAKDQWIADDDAFVEAVDRVAAELVEGLLATPYDGSLGAERALVRFTGEWLAHLQRSVVVDPNPPPRGGYVGLSAPAWHEVAVLKFVQQRFVLQRPDLALYQRGQANVLGELVRGFDAWLHDRHDAFRAPRRLIDLVELATEDYRKARREYPTLFGDATPIDVERMGRGRGLLDYIASLSDSRAVLTANTLTSGTERLWDAGSGL